MKCQAEVCADLLVPTLDKVAPDCRVTCLGKGLCRAALCSNV